MVTSTLVQRDAQARLGRAPPCPASSCALVDETGRRPEGDDPGEIHVAGANLFSGYWPDGADGPVDGWFATGDVGFLDPDGDLFLVDRLKELVIVSGFNVYPTEIEEVVVEVDGVAEAAVVGVPDERDRARRSSPTSVPPPSSGEAADDLRNRVRALCGSRLARFKQPSRVEVVEALPHTVTGKVAKGRLRATLRRQRPGLLE